MVFNFGKYVSLPFFLILFLLSSCSNVLVQENSGDIEVSLVVPEDSGRLASQRSVNATISLTHHVEGWIENQQGERLQTVNQDFSGSTVLSFKQVEPETVVRVFVRISDKSGVLYSGKSDFFTVERRGNQVSVELNNGDFPTGDEPVAGEAEMPATDTTTEDASPEDTETAGEGNSPAASAFDPSWITVTVVSRNNGTPNTVTASGSADGTSVTHNFYGIEGSQVQFSLSQEAIDAGMSLYINDGKNVGYASTKFYQESGTVQYAVQIQRSGETSSWYYFNVTSVMKPVTVTFTNLHYVYSSANNANAIINIYNSFTIGNQSVEGTIYKQAYYSTELTEKLKEKDFNVKVEFTSPTDTVTVAPSTNGATVSINNGSPSSVKSQNFSLKESLWGKTSVMWGDHLQLTYTISQQQ